MQKKAQTDKPRSLCITNSEKYIHHANLIDESAQKYSFLGYDLVDYQRSNILTFIVLRLHKKITPIILKTQKAFFFYFPILSRRLLKISPALDSQTIAMRISFLVKRHQLLGSKKEDFAIIQNEITNLLNKKSNESHGIGWGSIFNIILSNSKDHGNLIPSGISAMHSVAWATKALHDAYDAGLFPDFPRISQQITEHICKDYYFTKHDPKSIAVSYTCDDRTSIINVSAEASALLYRAMNLSENINITIAEGLLSFVLKTQKNDGSWGYTASDNTPDVHHASMILMALVEILDSPKLNKQLQLKAETALQKGAIFFLDNFFLEDGQPTINPRQADYWNTYSFPYAIRGLVTIIESTLLSKEEHAQAMTILLKTVDKTIELMDFKNDSIIIEHRMKKNSRLRTWRCGTIHMSLAIMVFLGSIEDPLKE